MSSLKPIGDRIALRLIDREDKTPSGIVLPQSNAKLRTAEVMAVSRGTVSNGQIIPHEVSVGDIVQVIAHGGDEILVDGEKFVLVPERMIIAVIQAQVTKMKKAQLLTE